MSFWGEIKNAGNHIPVIKKKCPMENLLSSGQGEGITGTVFKSIYTGHYYW